jgi:hypothetical protein
VPPGPIFLWADWMSLASGTVSICFHVAAARMQIV